MQQDGKLWSLCVAIICESLVQLLPPLCFFLLLVLQPLFCFLFLPLLKQLLPLPVLILVLMLTPPLYIGNANLAFDTGSFCGTIVQPHCLLASTHGLLCCCCCCCWLYSCHFCCWCSW